MTVPSTIRTLLDAGVPEKYRDLEMVAMLLFAIYFILTSESRTFQALGILAAVLAAFALGLRFVVGQVEAES